MYLLFQLPPPFLHLLMLSRFLPVMLLKQLAPQLLLVLFEQLLLLFELELDGILLLELGLVQLHLHR